MMPSKDPDRESPAILEEYPGDFLQDPELWVDQLPQPFRMIDDILLGMLENAWDRNRSEGGGAANEPGSGQHTRSIRRKLTVRHGGERRSQT